MATTERREALLKAAADWRASVTESDLPRVRQLAEVTARNLERQAETGVATCVCCNKPFGQGALSLR
jgi:hypothetical protein